MTEQATPFEPLTIDIVSDVVCPWCIVGFKRLEKALQQLDPAQQVEIRWHPYELHPEMPPEGHNHRDLLTQKYGITDEQSDAARENLSRLGEEVGFQFDFFQELRSYNTLRAHMLIHWAAQYGKQQEMKLALFSAHFAERKNVDDGETLVTIAVSVGLDEAAAREALVDKKLKNDVQDEEAHWRQVGIEAVPAFIYNEKYLLTGGQLPDAHLQLISKINSGVPVV